MEYSLTTVIFDRQSYACLFVANEEDEDTQTIYGFADVKEKYVTAPYQQYFLLDQTNAGILTRWILSVQRFSYPVGNFTPHIYPVTLFQGILSCAIIPRAIR